MSCRFPKAQSTGWSGVDWGITRMFGRNVVWRKITVSLQVGGRKRTLGELMRAEGSTGPSGTSLPGGGLGGRRGLRVPREAWGSPYTPTEGTERAERATRWSQAPRSKQHVNSDQYAGPWPKTDALALVFGTMKNLWVGWSREHLDITRMLERNQI